MCTGCECFYIFSGASYVLANERSHTLAQARLYEKLEATQAIYFRIINGCTLWSLQEFDTSSIYSFQDVQRTTDRIQHPQQQLLQHAEAICE